MIGRIFGVLTAVAFIYAALFGRMEVVSAAVSDSAASAVELSVALLGSMCLWNGVARVLDKGGFTRLLGRAISPFLAFAFPKSYAGKKGMKECAANIGANFLGLGGAALPTGLAAMRELCEGDISEDGRASDDAVMLAVLATTPFQLLPNTLAAMRRAFGSVAPYDVLLPIWICEIATTVFAILLCKALSKVF